MPDDDEPPANQSWQRLSVKHQPESPTWCNTAWIRNFKGDDAALALFFRRAAENVISYLALGRSEGPPDGLLMPVGYLYRHALELRLKALLRAAERAGCIAPAALDACRRACQRSHVLKLLWDFALDPIKTIFPDLDESLLRRQQGLVDDLHRIDSTGEHLRYSRTQQQAITVDAYPDSVELRELQEAYAELDEFLLVCWGNFSDRSGPY